MYEHHSKPLISHKAFVLRVSLNVLIALGLVAASLLVGMVGYREFEGMGWVDAFLNTAMLLGGMGEIDTLKTVSGKIFAGIFAIYCGLLVVITIGLILTPVLHRMLHHFHAHRPPEHH